MQKNNLDIHSESPYPADALSNFAPHPFIMDGVACASMEGFLQSLKFKEPEEQARICLKTGKEAKKAGQDQDWQRDQVLYWQGQSYHRDSKAYEGLITRAFDALGKVDSFRKALKAAAGCELDHSIGLDNSHETVLTRQEFLEQLYRLQKSLPIA